MEASVNQAEMVESDMDYTALLRVHGLTFGATVVFIVGEMAGSGVLALPYALRNAGWVGVALIVVCGVLSGYSGRNLGRCWSLLQQRWPEYLEQTRYPYPAIGDRAVGRWMRFLVSFSIHFTLFGTATVVLLLSAQNVQSMLEKNAHFDLSFCYWLLIMGGVLIPLTWLGTPKDFWPVAVGAFLATSTACLLILISIIVHASQSRDRDVIYPSPGFESLFLAFGAILFSFGGASTFPTIQHDMRQPHRFTFVIAVSFVILLCMYLPVALGGYVVYGDGVRNNILLSLPSGWMRTTAEVLITCHLLMAFVIIVNPVAQELEHCLRAPTRFTWRRCVLRTLLVVTNVFLAETLPRFGPIMNLIGGSTITFLTFVAPSLFYLRLSGMDGPWPQRPLPLHERVLNLEIIGLGLLGGAAATYSAVKELTQSVTFTPPCYINMTAQG